MIFTNAETQKIIAYVRETYGTELEFLWKRFPENAILRHRKNKKWYAAILKVERDKLNLEGEEKVEILNVKCDPIMKDILREKNGILPAYHMNKVHWISILLDGTIPAEEIFPLIDWSYEKTGKPGQKA